MAPPLPRCSLLLLPRPPRRHPSAPPAPSPQMAAKFAEKTCAAASSTQSLLLLLPTWAPLFYGIQNKFVVVLMKPRAKRDLAILKYLFATVLPAYLSVAQPLPRHVFT